MPLLHAHSASKDCAACDEGAFFCFFFFLQSCFVNRYIPALSGRVKCFCWLILCRWHICIWLDAETLLRCPCHVRRLCYLLCSPCEMGHDLFYWRSLYLHIYLTSPLLHLFLCPALLCLCDVRGYFMHHMDWETCCPTLDRSWIAKVSISKYRSSHLASPQKKVF